MSRGSSTKLNRRQRYLQVALNSTLDEARRIISLLPRNNRILIEAGTPLVKRYGVSVVGELVRAWYRQGLTTAAGTPSFKVGGILGLFVNQMLKSTASAEDAEVSLPSANLPEPYVVADLKTIDRGETEVAMAAEAGASAAVVMGSAPVETLNSFIAACEANHLDAMVDMMNVEYPLGVLRSLRKLPPVVILHRGVDEERDNKEKMLPLHEIRRLKGAADMMIAVAGGDTLREVQRSFFNDADIVVVWKSVYQQTSETVKLVEGFLKEIK